MPDINIAPRDKNSLDITLIDKTGTDLTFETIGGDFGEHDSDTFGSPRLGITKLAKNTLDITPRNKN